MKTPLRYSAYKQLDYKIDMHFLEFTLQMWSILYCETCIYITSADFIVAGVCVEIKNEEGR